MSLGDINQLGDEDLLEELRGKHLPESDHWQDFCDALNQRQTDTATQCLQAIETLLQQRREGTALSIQDNYPEEHTLTSNPRLAQAWVDYKNAIIKADYTQAQVLLASLRQAL